MSLMLFLALKLATLAIQVYSVLLTLPSANLPKNGMLSGNLLRALRGMLSERLKTITLA